ncbi:ABC transporter permease [Devosia sp. PTR5]|uniref:ABC transporter permease n=1 Tax=Devosia oryzisoli TaxID=2774138 RepID=A0A927FUI4_9HYPH|nr:ABC transporter permease [Devosia oryzisoli]MBD8065128.1 ABC transporter permease [Devosia oryzisoli]
MAEISTALRDDRGTDAATIIRPLGTSQREKALRILVPLAALLAFISIWQILVVWQGIPKYILPGPIDAVVALVTDSSTLWPALWVTLRITFMALGVALVGGVLLAIIIVQSRWLELALFPFTVILQVTPIIAVAPLILIYAPDTQSALMICAFLVAFFPILSNMVQGLKSVDHNLLNLFELYGAKGWQTLLFLKIPASMPYFMAGLRIAGGLSLIAAVVAEFAAGSAGQGSGLAFRLLESQYRLNLPRMFAALIMLCGTGIAIYALTSFLSWLTLHRWHESAIRREN